MRIKNLILGLNYGENKLRIFLLTIKDSNTIRQVSTYSSGFRIISLSAATSFYSLLGFDELYTGVNLKRLSQFVSSESRSGYSMDLGAIGVVNQKNLFFRSNKFWSIYFKFCTIET